MIASGRRVTIGGLLLGDEGKLAALLRFRGALEDSMVIGCVISKVRGQNRVTYSPCRCW